MAQLLCRYTHKWPTSGLANATEYRTKPKYGFDRSIKMDTMSTIGIVQIVLAFLITIPCSALAFMGIARRQRAQ